MSKYLINICVRYKLNKSWSFACLHVVIQGVKGTRGPPGHPIELNEGQELQLEFLKV